jgi:TATA-box binding protein (TBP) (component of TFIID and TFIIIB)
MKGQKLDLSALCELTALHDDVLHAYHQTKQPEQLIIRFNTLNTMLVFNSGAFRMMGRDDSVKSDLHIFDIVSLFSDDIPDLHLQTITVAHDFGRKINLQKLALVEGTILTAENFPAINLIKNFKPVHVNIFSTGKVTIIGIKDEDEIPIVISYLSLFLNDCFM